MAEFKATPNIPEGALKDLYSWIDQVPLSRPKKDIRRDFSDGVLVSEVVKHFIPQLVELHNYSTANALAAKIANWNLLDRKVFHRLGFELDKEVIKDIVTSKAWSMEKFLILLKRKIDRYLYTKQQRNGKQSESSDNPGNDLTKTRSPQASGDSTISTAKAQSLHNFHELATTQEKHELFPRVKEEDKDQELCAKEETIQVLQAKVKRLKHLLHQKDVRIEDLQERIEHIHIQKIDQLQI